MLNQKTVGVEMNGAIGNWGQNTTTVVVDGFGISGLLKVQQDGVEAPWE